MELKLSDFLQYIHDRSLDINKSMYDLSFDCLNIIIETFNCKNRNGDDLYLDKTRISKILSNKDNVPKSITKTMEMVDLYERIKEPFYIFYEDNIDNKKVKNTIDDQLKIYNLEHLKYSSKQNKNLKDVLLRLYICSLKTNNKLLNKTEKVIWKRGNSSLSIVSGDILEYGFPKQSNQPKDIVVIPVNTSFDVEITTDLEHCNNPNISLTTIHGKWLQKVKNTILRILHLKIGYINLFLYKILIVRINIIKNIIQ